MTPANKKIFKENLKFLWPIILMFLVLILWGAALLFNFTFINFDIGAAIISTGVVLNVLWFSIYFIYLAAVPKTKYKKDIDYDPHD